MKPSTYPIACIFCSIGHCTSTITKGDCGDAPLHLQGVFQPLSLLNVGYDETDTFQFDVALPITSISKTCHLLSAVYLPWKNLCIAQARCGLASSQHRCAEQPSLQFKVQTCFSDHMVPSTFTLVQYLSTVSSVSLLAFLQLLWFSLCSNLQYMYM